MHGSRTLPLLITFAAALVLASLPPAVAQDSAPAGLAGQTPATAVPAPPPPPPRTLSPVIWTEDPDVVQRFNVNAEAAQRMVDRALLKLTSAPDLATAWTRLGITPQDVVGIKITTMGGPLLSTHRPIIQAICDGLQAAGVPPDQIIIWDKYASDMRTAGYSPSAPTESHVGISAIFPGTGYDLATIYRNEILGKLIWGDADFVRRDGGDALSEAASDSVRAHGLGNVPVVGSDDPLGGTSAIPQTSNNSYYARLVTTFCTKIINVPVLTDNPYIGINGCLGSLALACVDNNRRFQGDPSYGDPAICEILDKPFIRHKVVVHILDSLVAQYAGGPRFDPQFTRSIGAIYVSRDPVAIDSIVLKRLEHWRATDREGRIDLIGKAASHVHSATYYNLGTDDPERIQLIHLQ